MLLKTHNRFVLEQREDSRGPYRVLVDEKTGAHMHCTTQKGDMTIELFIALVVPLLNQLNDQLQAARDWENTLHSVVDGSISNT